MNTTFTFTANFTDKASYLKWVAEWKEEYKAISKEIRELRIALQAPHGDALGYYAEAASKQSRKIRLRWKANSMMELRTGAKQKSWEMKQQAKLNKENESKA